MRQVATLGLAAGVLIGGLLVLHSVVTLAAAGQVWRGYYTVLIQQRIAPGEPGAAPAPAPPQVAQRLRAAGFASVVSAATASERITTFAGYERVAVADLAARLDQLDPRYDPYLRRVGDWFTTETRAGSAQLVYVASSLPPGYFAARLGWALRNGDLRWSIAELPLPRVGLALLLFAAAVALQTWRRDPCSPRWWRLLLALPWALIILHGELPAAFVAVPAYLAGAWLAGPIAGAVRQPWRGRWGAAVAAPAVLLGVVALGAVMWEPSARAGAPLLAMLPARDLGRMAHYLITGGLWFAALTVAGLTARWLAPAGAWLRAAAGGRRRRSAAAAAPARRRLGGFGSSVVVCLTGISLLLGAPRGAPVPRPLPVAAGPGFTLAALPALGVLGAGELPAFSYYVAHAAYQETLQFGRPFGLPAPGERVTMDQYRRGRDGRVLHATVAVAHFSDRWLQATLAALPDASLPALLVAQGRPVAARIGPPVPPTRSQRLAWIVLTLLLAGAMIGRNRWPELRPPVAAAGDSGSAAAAT